MTGDDELQRLVTRADLDGLIRLVDARGSSRDWDGLLRLREAARFSIGTGRQLWPAATLAEYRLALLAPPEWAARVVTEDAGRFAVGPLTEVVAQHHSWASLSGLLEQGPARAFVAHERALRGEVIPDAATLPEVLDLPLALEPWEPAYPLAVYEPDGAHFDPPDPVRGLAPVRLPATVERVHDGDVESAFRSLIEPWTVESNGRADLAAVEGDAAAAIAALGVPAARKAPLAAADALAWLGWAGASGGAHGRRRGAATGRFGAWWLLAAVADLLDDWPVPPGDLGAVASELRWWWWDAAEPATGWQLRLAVEDPAEGIAWAFHAQDQA